MQISMAGPTERNFAGFRIQRPIWMLQLISAKRLRAQCVTLLICRRNR